MKTLSTAESMNLCSTRAFPWYEEDMFDEEYEQDNQDISNGNQFEFAADKPPKKLDVYERLKTQMRSGFIAELKVPDIDTKQNIIRLKAEENEELLSK